MRDKMRQFCKRFHRQTRLDLPVEYQLNTFLEDHPNYILKTLSFTSVNGTLIEDLFAGFEVKEEDEE